jgi:sulfoxide reductase heme-binding subunit YedZ
MSKDILKRPFITAGFAAFVLMIPLAVTSTKKMIARLGGKRWQMLHRLIYISAIAGVIHYWWLVKSDIRKPLLYGAILAILLAGRSIPAPAFARYRATR